VAAAEMDELARLTVVAGLHVGQHVLELALAARAPVCENMRM
jgi:hypothetical protein